MSTSARFLAIDGYPQQLRVNFMKMQVSGVFLIGGLICAFNAVSNCFLPAAM